MQPTRKLLKQDWSQPENRRGRLPPANHFFQLFRLLGSTARIESLVTVAERPWLSSAQRQQLSLKATKRFTICSSAQQCFEPPNQRSRHHISLPECGKKLISHPCSLRVEFNAACWRPGDAPHPLSDVCYPLVQVHPYWAAWSCQKAYWWQSPASPHWSCQGSLNQHTKSTAGVKVVSRVSTLTVQFPAKWASSRRPSSASFSNYHQSVQSARKTAEDSQEQVEGSLVAVRFVDSHAAEFDLGIDEEWECRRCLLTIIDGVNDLCTRILCLPSLRREWCRCLPQLTDNSLLREWHLRDNLHEFAATQYDKPKCHHMFETIEVDIPTLSQRVFFERPPLYITSTELQAQWANRIFASRALRRLQLKRSSTCMRSNLLYARELRTWTLPASCWTTCGRNCLQMISDGTELRHLP